jgi:two-component system LytT family response regulator
MGAGPKNIEMKTIIIDDEPLARSIVREYLQSYKDVELAAECNDGFEGIKAIQQHQPDVIFLDIQMPKINGFEMLELIENPPAVIFTTAFDEFAIKAFESNAIDYLLKPFSKDRFDRALQKYLQHNVTAPHTLQVVEAAAQSPSQQSRVVVKDGTKIKIIPVSQIHYLEASDDYVKIVTASGTFLKKRTMNFFEQSLSQYHFVRVHRSYMVNTQLITRIDPYEKDGHMILLSTGARLPVSKAGYAKLKEVLGI